MSIRTSSSDSQIHFRESEKISKFHLQARRDSGISSMEHWWRIVFSLCQNDWWSKYPPFFSSSQLEFGWLLILFQSDDVHPCSFQNIRIPSIKLVNTVQSIIFGSSSKHDLPEMRIPNSQSLQADGAHSKGIFFECLEELCVRKFVKYGNLLAHLAHGNHKRIPERCSLIDFAKKFYHAKLRSAEEKRILSLSLEEADLEPNDCFDSPTMDKEGWALPVTNPPTRFSPKQKQFLNVSSSIWCTMCAIFSLRPW